MAYISNYSSVSSVSGALVFAVSDPRVADTRKITLTEITDYITANISANMSGYITQYSAPSATGFTVSVTDSQDSIHLILTPTAGFAAGTITLPAASNCLDGQMVLVNCTQAVTTLTIGANGATAVTGAPTTLAANAFFTLKYDKPALSWFRIG
jgi:hypothetical protein